MDAPHALPLPAFDGTSSDDPPAGDVLFGRDADWRAERRRMEATRDLFTARGRIRRSARAPLELVLRACRVALEAAGIDRRLFRSSLEVGRREIEVRLPDLPAAFDPYTILHLSDPHFDALDGLGAAIARACRGIEADLLALTGDLRAAETGRFVEHEVMDALAGVLEGVVLRDGAVAVLGNHDTQDMLEPLQALGLDVLANREVTLRRGADRLALVGLDDPHRFFSASTERCLAGLQADQPAARIFLVHSPELAGAAAAGGGALYLCGHTHGGQICLPGGRPLVRHLHTHRDLAAGLWRQGAMTGYTSPGAGVSASLPLRLFSRSEVTLFTLRRG